MIEENFLKQIIKTSNSKLFEITNAGIMEIFSNTNYTKFERQF
jgi:hypothetical protein